MSDERRFLELAELYLDDECSAADLAELRRLLEGDATLVQRLHTMLRDQVVCRTALRPADVVVIGERTRRMLDSWRPQSGVIAAQAVFARVDRRRHIALAVRWSSLAAAALIVILLLPFVLDWARRPIAQPDAQAPTIVAVSGEAQLDTRSLTSAGERLVYGSTLRLGAQAQATLVWSDGTRLVLGPDSNLTRLSGAGQRLRLDAGAVEITAAKRRPEQALEVLCPDATARVVGTRFTILVSEGSSRLTVDQGLVRWTREKDGVSSLVGAGQRVEAARLPLPGPVLMSVDQVAALRQAIAAGRQPWSAALASLQAEVPIFRKESLLDERVIQVPRYKGPRTELHSHARSLLNQLCRPMVGLALWSRLTDDEEAGRASLARLRIAMELRLEDEEADLLMSDMLTVSVVQAADLLRNQGWWDAQDSHRIDTWLAQVAQPAAERLAVLRYPSGRWRGVAALMSLYAWRGDREHLLAVIAALRNEMPTLLSPAVSQESAAGTADETSLYQIMSHALLAVDIARVAAGDITPPPPAWQAAVTAFLQRLGRLDLAQSRQELALGRALAGPEPWRTPAAIPLQKSGDPTVHSYAWDFPTLQLYDPRWE